MSQIYKPLPNQYMLIPHVFKNALRFFYGTIMPCSICLEALECRILGITNHAWYLCSYILGNLVKITIKYRIYGYFAEQNSSQCNHFSL